MRHFQLYWKIQGANIRSRMQYPFNFFVGIICVTAFGIFSTLFLWVLTRNFPKIIGWNYYDLLFVSSFNMVCYSLNMLLFIQLQDMDTYVRNADFDRILVRPMNSLFQFATVRFNVNSFGSVLYGLSILLYAGYHVRSWDVRSILIAILLVICGVVSSVSIHLIIASTSFITLQSGGLYQMTETIYSNTSNYPITIFSKSIQIFLTFIVPISFIGFFPSSSLLGKDAGFFGGHSLLVCVVGALVLAMLSYAFWSFSIRRYSGAGS